MDNKKPTSAVTGKKVAGLPGSFDIITSQDALWKSLLDACERYAAQYGFDRVELPLVEDPALYTQLYGPSNQEQTGCLVTAQAAGRDLAVRSNLLPSLVRVLAQVKNAEPQLTKWAYSGFGIYTAHKQVVTDYEFGMEVWGAFNHLTEAQVLGAAWQLFVALGLPDVTFEVNTCGNKISQEGYESTLKEFLRGKRYDLCDNCVDATPERPFDVLRCAKLDCQTVLSEAPTILDHLDEASRKYFTNLLEALEELQIPYQLNPLLVGMDGATSTVACLKLKLGEHASVVAEAEGHTGLIARLGGKNIHAFGLRVNVRLLHQALQERQKGPVVLQRRAAEVYLVPLGELAAKRSLRLFRDLVEAGVVVFDYFGYAGVKNQLKAAQEAGSPIALIMGQKEAVDEVVILRDVKSGMQEVFSYDKIVNEVKKRLGR
jgi:histidyl-tRNA synthetase